jgi:GMP synthase-like glutamine amidotransferase
MGMRAHYLQHVPFETPGSILKWLAHQGASVTSTRLFEPHTLPGVDDFDLLVVMGGPMSVNDEAEYPWLAAEKRFVGEAIDRGRAVVGVCLGAQVIASALGCRVYRNREREIGWFPIRSASDVRGWPDTLMVFHWHGETFDLPAGAQLLASSQGCVNQAFKIGDRVIGLQFHLEATPNTLTPMVEHCRDELTPDRYVQSEQELLATPEERYVLPNRLMDSMLASVSKAAQLAGAGSGRAGLLDT